MIKFLKKKSPFLPDEYQKTVFDIDINALQSQGIKILLFDLDNTLIPYDVSEPTEQILSFFAKIKASGLTIVVLSNNHKHRVAHFSNLANCLYVPNAKKPFAWGFKKAVRLAGGKSASEVCAIGDQFMTDVWGAKRLNYYVIVVDAIKRSVEKWYTRINRRLEKFVLLDIKKNYPEWFKKWHLDEKR